MLCRTVLLSIDPANRAWMQGRTYRDQLAEGDVMSGFTLCEVIADNDSGIAPGSGTDDDDIRTVMRAHAEILSLLRHPGFLPMPE